MEQIYSGFAEIYDKLMYDVDYDGLNVYLETLLKRQFSACQNGTIAETTQYSTVNNNKTGCCANGIEHRLRILDAGCGTGSMSLRIAQAGHSVVGIDLSADMIRTAKQKLFVEQEFDSASDCTFTVCDMTDSRKLSALSAGVGFDAVVSFFDCVNYLPDEESVKRAFSGIKSVLKPGGIFIFDINSPHKLRNILGNNFFYDIGDDICCLWENSYLSGHDSVKFELTFFIREPCGLYRRVEETHYENVYCSEFIFSALKESGFTSVQVYGDRSLNPLSECESECERLFFTAAVSA